MSRKPRKIAIFSDNVISNIFFLYVSLFFSCDVYICRVDMYPDCNGNGVKSRQIAWYGATKGKICLGNDYNSDFLIIKQCQFFFSMSQLLVVLKCLCLCGSYVTRLQWEWG